MAYPSLFGLVMKPWPWGGYGGILINGVHFDMDGEPAIRRVGPMVPPLTKILGTFFACPELKDALSSLDPCFKFSRIPVVKMVRLDWESWDRRRMPQVFPESGEPEDYLEELPDDPGLRERVPSLYEIHVPRYESEVTKSVEELERAVFLDIEGSIVISQCVLDVLQEMNALEFYDCPNCTPRKGVYFSEGKRVIVLKST